MDSASRADDQLAITRGIRDKEGSKEKLVAQVECMPGGARRRQGWVLGTRVDGMRMEEALDCVAAWVRAGEARTVCLANVHVVVSALDHEGLSRALSKADMVLPDGMPIALALRAQGCKRQRRIAGPDFALALCERLCAERASVFLYGSMTSTLEALENRLRGKFSDLRIAGTIAPPFREETAEEALASVEEINASGARVVLVGLGCPKQELWMEARRGSINAVLVGVGAAFDFHAGKKPRAPQWMQQMGLEWFHRLATEPRRLWRRYLYTNARFMVELLRQAGDRDTPKRFRQ